MSSFLFLRIPSAAATPVQSVRPGVTSNAPERCGAIESLRIASASSIAGSGGGAPGHKDSRLHTSFRRRATRISVNCTAPITRRKQCASKFEAARAVSSLGSWVFGRVGAGCLGLAGAFVAASRARCDWRGNAAIVGAGVALAVGNALAAPPDAAVAALAADRIVVFVGWAAF
jgi:hypothetical protein